MKLMIGGMGVRGVIKLFLWILGFVVFLYLFAIWFTGSTKGEFGLKPQKKTCYGFIVPTESVRQLSDMNIKLPLFTKKLVFQIEKKGTISYCLGETFD